MSSTKAKPSASGRARVRPRGRLGLGDYLWRPRRVFASVAAWAEATERATQLRPLPASLRAAEPSTAEHGFVARLTCGKVIGDMRLIATEENDVLGGLQALHGVEQPASHWSVHQWRLRRPRQLRGQAAVLAAAAGSNYYHWLFDSLPRLHLLQLAGIAWNDVQSFLINESAGSFTADSLALLGISGERLVRCSKRRITIVEQLLVPPMPAPRQGGVAPWMCDFLRGSFLPLIPPVPRGARLYLSRRHSPKRRLANEAEVERLFQAHGFTLLLLETLSFREQVAAFAGASVVAGPHGAGFANLVFAPQGAGVLEFFHPHHRAPNYERIAGMIGMNYRRVIGESPGERVGEMSERLGPYTVSLEQLKPALAELLPG